jgi:diacylglycerol kinase
LTERPEDHAAQRSWNRIDSFRYAFAGLWYMLRTQRNAWIHAAFTVVVVAVGFWLALDTLEWALIVLSIGGVWMAEFVNTALEAVVDLASPDIHPLARVGKDVAAGAVLVGAGTAVVVGLLVLGPPLLAKLRPLLALLPR